MSKLNLYLGCALPPFHAQHVDIMGGNVDVWTLVDKYVDAPNVKKWDARFLKEVEDGSVCRIYASHLLEHFSHREVPAILKRWYKKLIPGGEMILNVPDMAWAAKQILKFDKGEKLEGYYSEWEGEHGLQCVIYGSHEHKGEIHKSGFTRNSLGKLLIDAGFEKAIVEKKFEAHEMGCLLVKAIK